MTNLSRIAKSFLSILIMVWMCFLSSVVSAQQTFTYFSPTAGGEGDTITLKGTNFSSATLADIGGRSSPSVIFVNSTTIKAVVPINAISGEIVLSRPP
ncbi:MAG: IPT/TIG domain-containing protein, partial [Chitinophagaceae bacterium]